MYCINCGAKNPEEARFCAHCGHALEAQDTTSPSEAPLPSAQRAPIRRSPFPLLPITLGVVIVGMLIGGVYLGISLLGDSPVKAAKEWVQAIAILDGNRIAERTCNAQQANIQEAGLWGSVFALFGQQTIGQQANTDVSELKFTRVSSNDDFAAVRVTGQIRVAVLGVSQSQNIDETWSFVRENGKWKWCGQTGASLQSILPTEPGKVLGENTFTVWSDQGWQNTGLGIHQGDVISINYLSGEWNFWAGTSDPHGADGADAYCPSTSCCEPMPLERKGSLIGQIGDEVFLIGNGRTFIAHSNGTLSLRMNDCDNGLSDNEGTITVAITMQSK